MSRGGGIQSEYGSVGHVFAATNHYISQGIMKKQNATATATVLALLCVCVWLWRENKALREAVALLVKELRHDQP